MANAKRKSRMVIVGNGPYGLYYGETSATDEEILEKNAVRLGRCRHIAYWKGDVGGITSLAATGPADGSRIGKAAPSGLGSGSGSGEGWGWGSGEGSGSGSGWGSGSGSGSGEG